MPTPHRKIFTTETEEELLNMTRDEATLDLNDKQRAFCEYYIGNYNIKMAAIKAGYGPKSAHVVGWKLRQDVDVNRYLAWLKLRVGRECHVQGVDIVDHYIRIAFADITDFVDMVDGKLTNKKNINIKKLDEVDGQIIKTITQNSRGMKIEMHDKMRALEKLEQYFDVMPKNWKQDIEERKLQLLEERLHIDKIKIGLIAEEIQDDGFIQALIGEAETVWEDEVEFEGDK